MPVMMKNKQRNIAYLLQLNQITIFDIRFSLDI